MAAEEYPANPRACHPSLAIVMVIVIAHALVIVRVLVSVIVRC